MGGRNTNSTPAQSPARWMQAFKTTRMTRTFLYLLLGLLATSCNQTQNDRDEFFKKKSSVPPMTNTPFTTKDTFANLLNKALITDNIDFDNLDPFLFFKSGNFLNKNEKNVILIQCSTDSTYSINYYSFNNSNWKLTDSIGGLEAFPIQFYPIFDDYNFDEQNDIYIQVTASNGYSLSRGHLIIINPMTGKLEIHKEAREFANMKPDKRTQTIISEEAIWCKKTGFKDVGFWTNKWDKGQLKTIKKYYPCELGE